MLLPGIYCPRDVTRAVGVGAKKNVKKPTLMGAKFLKSDPLWVHNLRKKDTFERLFLTKFKFSVLIFVKIVKIPPL